MKFDPAEIQGYIDKTACFVVQCMIEKNLKLSLAESCTGGLVASAVTSVPGASKIFECGIVSYSERIKEELLGVPAEIIEKYGVVSAETALSMAENSRRISGSDIAVGITGLAGPGGDGVLPEGTIYVSVVCGDEALTENLRLEQYGSLGRELNRLIAAAEVFKRIEGILSRR